jgi:hypothetical protein
MKYISSEFIIASVARKFGVSANQYSIDIYESIGEALSILDIPLNHTVEYDVTSAVDYKIEKDALAIDVYNVFVNNKLVKPNRKITSASLKGIQAFHTALTELIQTADATKQACGMNLPLQVDDCGNVADDWKEQILKNLNGDILTFNTFYKDLNETGIGDYWWEDSECCIKTNFNADNVVVQYTKPLVDERGYPLIQDEQKLITYVEWYCMRGLVMKGLKHPIFSFGDLEALTEKWQARATNQQRRRTPRQMELFKLRWTNSKNYIRENFYTN